MKKKLFLLLCAVLSCAAGTQKVHAAAADYLTGWTEVTSLPTSNDDLDDYYYVFVATEADLMMAQELGTGKSGDTQEGKLTMVYRTAANPLSHTTMVWTLEYSETYKYGIRNLNNPTHLMQSRENEPYRVQFAWETVQSKWTRWNLAYASDSWTIENNACKTGDTYFSDQYIGPWTAKAFADNNVVAGNKTGDNVGHFKIYRILRSEYLRLNPTAYITNADFEASATYDKSSSATVTTNQQATFQIGDGWTQTSKGDWAMGVSVAYGSNATLNSVNAPAKDPDGNDGVAVFFSAGHGNEVLFKQNSNVTLNPGTYILRYKGYNQNNGHNNILIRFGFVASDKSITPPSSNEAFAYQTWVEKSIPITVNSPTEGYFQIGAQGVSGAGGSGNNAKIFIDGLTLEYTDFKAELRAVITQAQAINARISTLSSDITTAQGVLDNASASKTTIDGAVSTLRTAISTKLAAYEDLDPAGDDITSFIANNGFETSPTFDGTSLGSNNDPKSNATPTAGSTLLLNAKNVYQVNGWELLTTETSDFARTFTMPYDKTLYVVSSNAVAGQAVTSPTNGSSVSTSNNDLLFVEANWCPDAVLGVKQTIPLPAGSYRLTFDSYVTNAIGNAESLCGVSYDKTTDYKWPAALNTWTANGVDFTLDAPTDVTISMGYKKSANVGGGSSAFLFVDNVKLTYYNPLALAKIQWAEAKEAAENFDKTVKMSAATLAALNVAINTYATDAIASSEDIDEVNAAKDALTTAVDNANASKDVYVTLNTAITTVEGWTATTAAAGLRTKYDNGSYSDETTANDIYTEYQAAEIAALAAADASTWTSAIINASFETGDMTGWSAASRADTGVKDQSNGTYSITSGDPVDGSKLFNSWGGTAENNVYQTIKGLPAGTYTLTALVAGFKDEELVLSANETTNSVTVKGDKTVGYTVDVIFTLAEAGDVEIKASNTKKSENSDASFIKADNFHLTYLGDVAVEFGASGFATFACDEPVSLPNDESIKGYTASTSGTSTITFKKITDGVIPANTGVMLSGTPNTTMYMTFAASDKSKSSEFVRGSGSAPGKDDANYYFAIKKSAADLTFGTFDPATVAIATNKAYFKMARSLFPTSARPVILFDDDDTPTAINSIEAAETKAEGLKDGKYLVKGRIVIVKNGVKFSANGQKLN